MRRTTYHEERKKIRKRGPGAGLEALVAKLVTGAAEGLRKAARDTRNTRPVTRSDANA